MSAASFGALLDAVRGVHWRARRAVGSPIAGSHQSKLRGTSAEFTEYRLYRQGDDPRRIDWRLLARSDRAYIRLATDRAILPTMIVVDGSASMGFPSGARSKWARAAELAVGLAAVAHADGDPVGVTVAGRDSRRVQVPPRTRRGVVGEIARVLSGIAPEGSAPLGPTVAALHLPRLAIVTDLLGDADAILSAARIHIAGGGEAHVVHVVAREELEPPRRALLAVDPERRDLHRMLVDATRAGYERAFADWRAEMARRWRAAGAAYTEVATDEPPAHAVRRIAEPVAPQSVS
jgi:uncharacterized protein (DUF58 family)